jgi:hypothetical protein
MKLITTALTLVLCWAASPFAFSQNDPASMLERFFVIYESQPPDAAIDYVFDSNPYLKQNQESLVNIKDQLNGLLEVVGPYQSSEKIQFITLGKSFQLHRYLVKYDRQPILFSFILYKPKDQWRFQNFMFDSQADEILNEASALPKG